MFSINLATGQRQQASPGDFSDMTIFGSDMVYSANRATFSDVFRLSLKNFSSHFITQVNLSYIQFISFSARDDTRSLLAMPIRYNMVVFFLIKTTT